MTKKLLLTLMMMSIWGISAVFAHAVWMETAAAGQKGVSQEVNVYFGEFGTEDISTVDKWFSDLSDFKLVLHTPDNKQVVLKVDPDGEKKTFKAHFTPDKDGIYKLAIHKVAKEVSYGYLLDYTATATVQVGDTVAAQKSGVVPNLFNIQTEKALHDAGQAAKIKLLVDSTLKGDREITVIAPNGWTKTIYLDENGGASFVPLWPGKYLVETTVTAKDLKDAMHNGSAYTTGYYCGTHVLEVK